MLFLKADIRIGYLDGVNFYFTFGGFFIWKEIIIFYGRFRRVGIFLFFDVKGDYCFFRGL